MKKLFFFILLLRILPLIAQKDSVTKFYWSAGIIGGVNKNAGGFTDSAGKPDFLGSQSTSTVETTDNTEKYKRNTGAKFSFKYKYKKVIFAYSTYLMYCESQFSIHNWNHSASPSHNSTWGNTIYVSNYIMLNQNELSASINLRYFYLGLGLTANSELIKNYSAYQYKGSSGYTIFGSSSSTYSSEPYKFEDYKKINYLSYSLFLSVPIKPIKSVVFVRLNRSKLYNHFMFNLGFDKNFYFNKKSKKIKD